MSSRSFIAALLSGTLLVLSACGGYHESHVKQYNLYFSTSDSRLQVEAQRLIAAYNREAGIQVLNYSARADDSNSVASFVDGLKDSEGKLGFGRWETSMYQEPDFRRLEGRTLERVVRYSMELEFDHDFWTERAGLAATDPEWRRLYLLFCHEVGHGLQMNHVENDDTDVMYPVIKSADPVRFDRYFQQVRSFLTAP